MNCFDYSNDADWIWVHDASVVWLFCQEKKLSLHGLKKEAALLNRQRSYFRSRQKCIVTEIFAAIVVSFGWTLFAIFAQHICLACVTWVSCIFLLCNLEGFAEDNMYQNRAFQKKCWLKSLLYCKINYFIFRPLIRFSSQNSDYLVSFVALLFASAHSSVFSL